MATAGERLRQLAGFSGSAAVLLLAIGTGATAGDLLASRSGLETGSAGAHLLADSTPHTPIVGIGSGSIYAASSASGTVLVSGSSSNSADIVSQALGTVLVSGTGTNDCSVSSGGAGKLLVLGVGDSTASVGSAGDGHVAFLAVGANTVEIGSVADGIVTTPRATRQAIHAAVAYVTINQPVMARSQELGHYFTYSADDVHRVSDYPSISTANTASDFASGEEWQHEISVTYERSETAATVISIGLFVRQEYNGLLASNFAESVSATSRTPDVFTTTRRIE